MSTTITNLHEAVHTAFFSREVLHNTIVHMVNNSTLFLNDTLLDVVCLCMKSPFAVNIGDRGIGLFRANYNVTITFKQLTPKQLAAVTALVQHAYDNGSYYISRQRGGEHSISFPHCNTPIPISHADILVAVHRLILQSHRKTPQSSISLSADRVANIILQRVRNLVYVHPESLRDFQNTLKAKHENAAREPGAI